MKGIFFIPVFFVAVKATKAQVPDTLAYLQSIVANKAQFVGQPFSKLMDSLKIEIKHFSRNTDIVYDISKETSTSFGFYFPNNTDEIYLAYPRLRITWQTPLNANQSDILWKNANGGSWSSVVTAFYANGITADIKVQE